MLSIQSIKTLARARLDQLPARAMGVIGRGRSAGEAAMPGHARLELSAVPPAEKIGS